MTASVSKDFYHSQGHQSPMATMSANHSPNRDHSLVRGSIPAATSVLKDQLVALSEPTIHNIISIRKCTLYPSNIDDFITQGDHIYSTFQLRLGLFQVLSSICEL